MKHAAAFWRYISFADEPDTPAWVKACSVFGHACLIAVPAMFVSIVAAGLFLLVWDAIT